MSLVRIGTSTERKVPFGTFRILRVFFPHNLLIYEIRADTGLG